MKTKRLPPSISLALFLIALAGSAVPLANATDDNVRITPVVKAVEATKLAVVNISTQEIIRERANPFSGYGRDPFFDRFFENFFEPRFQRQSVKTSLGSGVIIDPNGYVLTNWHVVERASKITVTTIDERTNPATLVGADPKLDLAVLKIESESKFPQITLGDSDDILIGETVIAIGNPFGLSHTVTTGVVSALHRSIRKDEQVYENFIQTDASINPGNSGGPLLNIKGELIGINTAIYGEAQGIGFAIPINTAKRIVDDLLKYGEVHPPWLGIYVQDLTEKLARYFNYQGKHGVVITEIFPDSPAEKKGLKKGDIITAIDKQKIKSKQSFDLVLSSFTANDTIDITIFRQGVKKELSVKASEFPLQYVEKLCWDILGLEVMNNNRGVARKYGLYSQDGVVIKRIKVNGQAFKKGLKAGDIILQVQGNGIQNVQEFEKFVARFMQRETILVLVQRGPYGYYLNLRMS